MTLPPPGPAFDWTAEAWGHALRSKPLAAIAQHVFTTKQLRLRASPSSGRTEALGGRSDLDVQSVGWTQAAASVGSGLEQVMRVKQVHGARVRVLKKGEVGPRDVVEKPEGDAIVSNAPGLVLSVQVADCVPILVADPKTGAVAAIHAGWRGTCAGVARVAIDAMAKEFGATPGDLVAAIGPSIGPCCYTVGRNVLTAFANAGASGADIGRWFLGSPDDSLQLDLWTANRDQLLSAGLRDDNVHVCALCTRTHHEIFESYRVDGERAGRMAALIAVP